MKIYQSGLFERKIKKLHKEQKLLVDREIKKIAANPKIGEEKKGDLKGVFVYKFKIKTQQYLLAYRKTGDDLELIAIGSHENYYKNLKIYLSS